MFIYLRLFLKKFEEKFNEGKEDFKLLVLRVYDFSG